MAGLGLGFSDAFNIIMGMIGCAKMERKREKQQPATKERPFHLNPIKQINIV